MGSASGQRSFVTRSYIPDAGDLIWLTFDLQSLKSGGPRWLEDACGHLQCMVTTLTTLVAVSNRIWVKFSRHRFCISPEPARPKSFATFVCSLGP